MYCVPKTNVWNNCSSSRFATMRINKEFNDLLQNPVDDISCGPIDDNYLYWNVVFYGPQNTPYSNGIYHLLIDFPTTYPISAPFVRFDYKHCKCYHKDIDKSGNIISMLNTENWWNVTMGIKDLLIKLRNILYHDNLSAIIKPQSMQLKYHIDSSIAMDTSCFLVDHIIKACLYNHKYCHGPPVPIWLLSLRYNNRTVLKITKEKHINDITTLKSIFYSNTRFCDRIINEVIGYYGNQWYCCNLWTQFENYYPLIKFIEDQCKKL
eukprot:282432_1